MHRCIELAQQGSGYVAPNPMVGAVLVHDGRIIGEGWHQQFGEAHAEVNCIASVKEEKKSLISRSALYVSLEPCAHFGKTPPCTELIIKNNIPKVIIGCLDPAKEVNGNGIKILTEAGIDVVCGMLEKECKEQNKRFFTFQTLQRPYIILKWAQTKDKKIAPLNPPAGEAGAPNGGTYENLKKGRLLISNEFSNRLVHKWRSEEASILVGSNTALLDNPELTNRHWNGASPTRLVIDKDLKLPMSLKLFNGKQRTIIFNSIKQNMDVNPGFFKLRPEKTIIPQVLNGLYQLQIQSVLVEGGAMLLQSFIDEGIWDEARIITNAGLEIKEGIHAPVIENLQKIEDQRILNDKIEIFINNGC